MYLSAPDGRRWKVFRRRLTWRPRLPQWIHTWWPSSIDDDSVFGLITAAAAVITLLIMSPWLIWHALSWTAAVLATPFAWLARSTLGLPTPVIAYPLQHSYAEYQGTADGTRAADDLIALIAREINQYGTPRSLTAPSPHLLELTTQAPRPIIDRLKDKFHGKAGNR
ncbi:hypothetical protein [Actinoplanes auranticolor]|uniref:Uncharacterized protein n=1 Tax=Actinoplanes auranticolor TaxID=47988 RepID=A0A919S6J0_9ACTN|nr:hypothetical protein [Actinoplanes auranticolor]GIM66498.1 hypothetical protein Aau02nite_23190 [Actinoplanes auranticolor]